MLTLWLIWIGHEKHVVPRGDATYYNNDIMSLNYNTKWPFILQLNTLQSIVMNMKVGESVYAIVLIVYP